MRRATGTGAVLAGLLLTGVATTLTAINVVNEPIVTFSR